MRNIVFAALVLTLAFFAGCRKELEIDPYTSVPESQALGSADGMDGALTNAYAITAQYVGQRFTFWSEVLADHVKIIAAQDRSVMNFYNRDQALIADETANNGTNESSNRLRSIYQALNAAALVRRAAESGRVTEYAFVTNKDRIIGECYFIRAVLHFEMVRLWGHPWGKTPDNSHPGIIINKEPVENRESQIKARASVAEVYGLIIEDLLKAEELLPPSFDVGVHSSYFAGRATQDAARGYLAKVYFQQNNFPEALAVINRIIGPVPGNLSAHPLESDIKRPYATRGPEDISPENIFQTTSPITGGGFSNYWNGDNSIYRLDLTRAAPNSRAVASTAFLNDARLADNDLRKKELLYTFPDGSVITRKFNMLGTGGGFNFPVIRSAEMVLDRAEINALAGKVSEAVADCNLIRSRAGISLLTPGIGQGALLDTIRLERVRELSFEGDRLHNLKRMKQDIPAGDRPDQTFLPWDSNKLIFQYDPNEIVRNKLLEQNPS